MGVKRALAQRANLCVTELMWSSGINEREAGSKGSRDIMGGRCKEATVVPQENIMCE